MRHLIPFDKRQNNLAYTLMLTFLAKKEKKPHHLDSDGDGVTDNLDQETWFALIDGPIVCLANRFFLNQR